MDTKPGEGGGSRDGLQRATAPGAGGQDLGSPPIGVGAPVIVLLGADVTPDVAARTLSQKFGSPREHMDLLRAGFQRHGRCIKSGSASSQYGDGPAREPGEVDSIACVGGQVCGKRTEVRRQSRAAST